MTKIIHTTIDDACEVEYGTRVVQKRDAGYGYPVYGGGGATFQMDVFNRENRIVVSRFGISQQCTRWVEGKFYLNDSGLTLKSKNPELLTQEYLDYLTMALSDQIYATAKGTAQKNVEMPAFRKIKISFPSDISMQANIVNEVRLAREKTALLRVNYLASIRGIDKLEKSILRSKMVDNFDE